MLDSGMLLPVRSRLRTSTSTTVERGWPGQRGCGHLGGDDQRLLLASRRGEVTRGHPWRIAYQDRSGEVVAYDYLRSDGTAYLRIPEFSFLAQGQLAEPGTRAAGPSWRGGGLVRLPGPVVPGVDPRDGRWRAQLRLRGLTVERPRTYCRCGPSPRAHHLRAAQRAPSPGRATGAPGRPDAYSRRAATPSPAWTRWSPSPSASATT